MRHRGHREQRKLPALRRAYAPPLPAKVRAELRRDAQARHRRRGGEDEPTVQDAAEVRRRVPVMHQPEERGAALHLLPGHLPRLGQQAVLQGRD